MDYLTILAATSTQGQTDYGTQYVLQTLDYVWQQATVLTWQQAVIGISFGVIYLMYGWRIYKALTTITFALLGLYLGMWAGTKFSEPLLGAMLGGGLCAILAIPLMRWAVSILGAVAGGILAAAVWRVGTLPEQYVWAGALVGVVAGAMLSFVLFKGAVMLFTSFAGGCLVVIGAFALVYRFETMVQDPPTTHLNDLFYNNPWFLAVLLWGITLVGIAIQYKFVKGSKDWSL